MTWINTVAYEEATGKLKKLYDRVKGPDNNVDNIMLAHSLRPHSMEGHMAIYKNVIHHSGNKIDKWLLEACGVGLLNRTHTIKTRYEKSVKQLKSSTKTSLLLCLNEKSYRKGFKSRLSGTLKQITLFSEQVL